ncbi:isopentenyl-diphosphate delta-isomerase [Thamnocephalis sphaerospora]|uniref:isopentenyl-diphosphate Delta-isomerase n=1 Tax=Thamnocephalis sphaerospora TaxID=78915 RepID=A0A4P9XQL6_9FUNG|nr:isopentenyl-diphosphate delta-isomerase [Thamnocephalis sphaerospora]|eukprot:RKP07580.1 isopentenyl-diphosphate delta-isomerase [Thamnocephalis sphaerospora]
MSTATAADTTLAGYDAEQVRLMEECCILVDKDDRRIGFESKKTCHLMTNIKDGLLHRAFSVFIFDSQDRLLLQQRADEKITFPGYWTNTCCSHPLNKEDELVEENQLGVKCAAQRKLEHELGIPFAQAPLEKMEYLTRIHYLAPSDGLWGEHEIDYVLFLRANVDLNINANEVKATRYVTADELREMFKQADAGEIKMTPWFRLIAENMLFGWWEKLDQLDSVKQPDVIHRY